MTTVSYTHLDVYKRQALGRRKSAIARIFVSEGTGKITINKRDLAEYFPSSILQYEMCIRDRNMTGRLSATGLSLRSWDWSVRNIQPRYPIMIICRQFSTR